MARNLCGEPLGLNPRLRVLKYDYLDNDRFEPHFDATTVVGTHQKSLLTVLLYLNDGGGVDFEGGETLYLNSDASSTLTQQHETKSAARDTIKVTPATGKVVIFEHDLFHSGAPLEWGTKYVLRTDILFAVKKDGDDGENGALCEHRGNSSTLLVSNLCEELHLSEQDMGILDALDMLEISIDSFVSPGITIIKRMLKESGMNGETADELAHAASRRSIPSY
jgi:hypothetical protein